VTTGGPHRTDAWRQRAGAIVAEDALRVGPGPVDLVDEDQGRDAERWSARNRSGVCGWTPSTAETTRTAPSRTPEDALDLRDEVRVAGRVDEVDREVADEERGDRGPDRDAAFALEVERVGLGGAGVDAADASMAPAVKRSRSVRVVLPASTCARIPRLSVRMEPHAFQEVVTFWLDMRGLP
jgi:hypothetical protein